MSYKNDSYLVISNKYGGLSSDATAQLFETYDLLRDITVSGTATDGAGFVATNSEVSFSFKPRVRLLNSCLRLKNFSARDINILSLTIDCNILIDLLNS